MDERHHVRDQHDPCGILVQPADTGWDGCAPSPVVRQEIVDQGAFAGLVRADVPGRFMEHDEDTRRMIEGLSVEQDFLGAGLAGAIGCRFSLDADPAAGEKGTGGTAGGIAEVGENPVKSKRDLLFHRKNIVPGGRGVYSFIGTGSRTCRYFLMNTLRPDQVASCALEFVCRSLAGLAWIVRSVFATRRIETGLRMFIRKTWMLRRQLAGDLNVPVRDKAAC